MGPVTVKYSKQPPRHRNAVKNISNKTCPRSYLSTELRSFVRGSKFRGCDEVPGSYPPRGASKCGLNRRQPALIVLPAMLSQLLTSRPEDRYRPAKSRAGLLRLVLFTVHGYPYNDSSLENHGLQLGSCQFPPLKTYGCSALPIIQNCPVYRTKLTKA